MEWNRRRGRGAREPLQQNRALSEVSISLRSRLFSHTNHHAHRPSSSRPYEAFSKLPWSLALSSCSPSTRCPATSAKGGLHGCIEMQKTLRCSCKPFPASSKLLAAQQIMLRHARMTSTGANGSSLHPDPVSLSSPAFSQATSVLKCQAARILLRGVLRFIRGIRVLREDLTRALTGHLHIISYCRRNLSMGKHGIAVTVDFNLTLG